MYSNTAAIAKSDAATYAANIIGITFLVSQFALYTFPAEQVATEFLDISNAIYSSKWYENDKVTQKLVLFVMMKSQQCLYFTGAGLVDINAGAFEAVVRKSFSFGAIVKNLLQI
ncbi:7tm Odorant receptor [Popillia japonica]|uniref:7tm Odorant receptor n=1 Tax=Popillia japonica TaxID=7064 RepID=A0AAW1IDF9_POPJA